MSNKLIKESGIEIPGDDVVVSIQITRSGKKMIHAPTVHPRDLCVILSSVQFDVMYASFQMHEQSRIAKPELHGV